MNTMNSRGIVQRMTSLAHRAAHKNAAKARIPAATMIPTIELQRLVATMVD